MNFIEVGFSSKSNIGLGTRQIVLPDLSSISLTENSVSFFFHLVNLHTLNYSI